MTTLKNELNSVNNKLNTLEHEEIVRTILFGDKNFDSNLSLKILTETINFIK